MNFLSETSGPTQIWEYPKTNYAEMKWYSTRSTACGAKFESLKAGISYLFLIEAPIYI